MADWQTSVDLDRKIPVINILATRQLSNINAHLCRLPRLPQSVIVDRLADWRRLLRQSMTQGRAVIQRIVKGRIEFTPALDGVEIGKDDGKPNGYTFEAPT